MNFISKVLHMCCVLHGEKNFFSVSSDAFQYSNKMCPNLQEKSSSLLFFLLFGKSSGVINTFFVGVLIERQARYTI